MLSLIVKGGSAECVVTEGDREVKRNGMLGKRGNVSEDPGVTAASAESVAEKDGSKNFGDDSMWNQ